ncbi:MAG: hypothetical protein A2Z18_11085 [Armatimonadetes bacterium RBG_16_58_9]|nr:MAG: hypothetical protein A2Z18_11085 [Armatimonadetes bacterium RBG_16_58_9]
MNPFPTIITAPTTEAISLAELKLQSRIDASTEDAILELYRTAARKYYEVRTERTIHQTELEIVLNSFPSLDYIELPRATPLILITSVKYYDSAGTEATMSAAEYIADTWTQPIGRLVLDYGESWPSFTPYPVAPIRVRYKAGIATTSPVTEADAADKIPILLLAAALYENREGVNIADQASIAQVSMKYGIEAFIALRQARYVF